MCDFGYFEVVRFPAYFSYPLDKVIVPRYEYLKAKAIPFQLVTIDEVLRYGDTDFARIVVGDRDGGALFSRFLEERSKRQKQKIASQQSSKNVVTARTSSTSRKGPLQRKDVEESPTLQRVEGQSPTTNTIITGEQIR